MFVFDLPYEAAGLEPQEIRDDFAELCDTMDAADLLQRLACQLSTDKLAEFMDDLAMGRV